MLPAMNTRAPGRRLMFDFLLVVVKTNATFLKSRFIEGSHPVRQYCGRLHQER